MKRIRKTISRYERALLKEVKEKRLSAKRCEGANGKICANINCPLMGATQEAIQFYKKKRGSLDSYCSTCKKISSRQRYFDKMSGIENLSNTGSKQQNWKLNLGKAPWCKAHKDNSVTCGCAESSMFFKSKSHRKKLAEAAKGNRRARGNKYKNGPMSAEHKMRISMAMRASSHRRKEVEKQNNGN